MANNPQSSAAQPVWPPVVGSMPPQGFSAPFPMQFRPGMQGQPFAHISTAQQFRPVGQVQNVGMLHGQNQPPQFSQPMQQFPPRPANVAPASQPIPNPFIQTNMPIASSSPQPQQMGANMNNLMSVLGGPGVPFSSSYTFAPSSFGQTQNGMNPSSQFHAPVASAVGQTWLQPGSQSAPTVTHLQQATPQPPASVPTSSDWQEFEAAEGKRYYYNKVTRQSSWEKPLELMTPIERADASTVWKEFTTAEGRKYYYNKETKQSKWTMPEELKLAREQAEKAASQEAQLEIGVPAAATGSSVEQPSLAVTSVSSYVIADVASSPVPVTPVAATATSPAATISGSAAVLTAQPAVASAVPPHVSETVTPPTVTPGSLGVDILENNPSNIVESSVGEISAKDIEEAKKGMAVAGKVNVTTSEEKPSDEEPLVYASKQEAKNAFKALLEFANVEADWTWDQAMRLIINDKRYGALKTLGERKQAFNEYLMQRKKIEAEERRLRQRKAKEEFTKMLEESQELASSTRWSKAVTMFEDDERFKAVEKEADRGDLFRNYLMDLQKKERAKAQEEHRRNRLEYRQYLETCGFVKVDSQWRKVQDLLEDDERCSRLDKIDRLEIYQEYIRDLEREEEEQRKVEKEQMRRSERKNRDAFRKLIEEHVAAGILTAKTHWRDYCQMVKDTVAYQGVALNTSGSTPMDLFEDVFEELEKQYLEDKAHVKDAVKLEKITILPTWTFEEFLAAMDSSINSLGVSDTNLQLIFEDLLERAKEKEEKEARKRQRLAKDFSDLLNTVKEITATSNWEDAKQFVEASLEYRSVGEESICKEIFEEHVTRLQEKTREKERKREEEKAKKEKEREEKEKKKKEKDREEKEKEKEHEREREKGKERSKKDDVDSESMDVMDDQSHKEEKKREKVRDKKHRRRHHSATDDVSSDKDEKEESKKSRRHGSDRRKSRKHGHSPESDSESRHKRHRRDHRDGSRQLELEDGEVGEDGEIP